MSTASRDAHSCLCLAYKYNSLVDCVTDQRPQLLDDPTLRCVAEMRAALDRQFEQRVRELAEPEMGEET